MCNSDGSIGNVMPCLVGEALVGLMLSFWRFLNLILFIHSCWQRSSLLEIVIFFRKFPVSVHTGKGVEWLTNKNEHSCLEPDLAENILTFKEATAKVSIRYECSYQNMHNQVNQELLDVITRSHLLSVSQLKNLDYENEDSVN